MRAARAAIAAALADDASVGLFLAFCDRIIDRYKAAAIRQQRQGRVHSAFARGGAPDRTWQPSPVVIAPRELNAGGEAHALRAKLLNRIGRHREALDDPLALDEYYPDAQQPIAIRQFSAGFGWIVAEDWQRWSIGERRQRLLGTMVAPLGDSKALERDVNSVLEPSSRRGATSLSEASPIDRGEEQRMDTSR